MVDESVGLKADWWVVQLEALSVANWAVESAGLMAVRLEVRLVERMVDEWDCGTVGWTVASSEHRRVLMMAVAKVESSVDQ